MRVKVLRTFKVGLPECCDFCEEDAQYDLEIAAGGQVTWRSCCFNCAGMFQNNNTISLIRLLSMHYIEVKK